MAEESVKLLIIDDEPGHIHWMSRLYTELGISVLSALTLNEAREIIKKEKPQIVTLETYIYNGHWFLQEIRQFNSETIRIVLTTSGDQDYFTFLTSLGLAEYCLRKPCNEEEFQRLSNIVAEAVSFARSSGEQSD